MADALTFTDIICWTRMQAEAGESLEAIVARKEAERQFGDGHFAWGVGNAPARLIPSLVQAQVSIDLVFSVMRSRPRPADVAPASVVRWTRFVDADGWTRDLPSFMRVTSRGGAEKTKHFALLAYSDEPLLIADAGPFDHLAWRNAGDGGGIVGASQVTALLQRWRDDGKEASYRVAMQARLARASWVRLTDPEPVR